MEGGGFRPSQSQFSRDGEWMPQHFPEAICLRTGKEIRFRFWMSEDKAGKEAKRRPGSQSFADTAGRTCLPAGRAAASKEWKIIYLQVLKYPVP